MTETSIEHRENLEILASRDDLRISKAAEALLENADESGNLIQ